MATNKSKKTNKKSSKSAPAKVKETKEVKEVKDVKPAAKPETETKVTKIEAKETDDNPFRGFFARKCDPNENILTIFKNPRFYGAIIGELFGTMILTMILMSLGIYQPLYILFGLIAITGAVYGLSGANLNPIVTAGMMASRRVSAIRGVMYILAQIFGAWVGMAIVNLFRIAGDGAAELPKMAEVDGGQFWVVTMIEFVGAIMIGLFFARALAYKKSPLTFAMIVGSGVCIALLFAIVISSNFVSLQDNFILNPAIALMYGILPSGGENVGELLGGIGLALVTYWLFPMLGGIIGFGIADIAGKLAGENCCCKECEKK